MSGRPKNIKISIDELKYFILIPERDFPDDGDDEADVLIPAISEDTPHIPYRPVQRSDDEILERSREYYELMAKRRTVRSFSPEPIPSEVLDNIIKTAGKSLNIYFSYI